VIEKNEKSLPCYLLEPPAGPYPECALSLYLEVELARSISEPVVIVMVTIGRDVPSRVVKNDFLLRISIVRLQLRWSRRKNPQRISVDTPPPPLILRRGPYEVGLDVA
jgi:hypothetical protein